MWQWQEIQEVLHERVVPPAINSEDAPQIASGRSEQQVPITLSRCSSPSTLQQGGCQLSIGVHFPLSTLHSPFSNEELETNWTETNWRQTDKLDGQTGLRTNWTPMNSGILQRRHLKTCALFGGGTSSKAGPDQNVVIGQQVELNGVSSTDPEGSRS